MLMLGQLLMNWAIRGHLVTVADEVLQTLLPAKPGARGALLTSRLTSLDDPNRSDWGLGKCGNRYEARERRFARGRPAAEVGGWRGRLGSDH